MHSPKPFRCTTACLSLWAASACLAQRSTFDVLKGDETVGSIIASRSLIGARTLYVTTSWAEFDLLWRQNVRTTSTTEYAGDSIHACRTAVRVNGSVRDSSHMAPSTGGLACYVHPDKRFRGAPRTEWTTARMYFEEPVGQARIFVESVLEPCALRSTAPGCYQLIFPNGAENRYRYANGILQEVHVDRTFLDLVFRRRAEPARP